MSFYVNMNERKLSKEDLEFVCKFYKISPEKAERIADYNSLEARKENLKTLEHFQKWADENLKDKDYETVRALIETKLSEPKEETDTTLSPRDRAIKALLGE